MEGQKKIISRLKEVLDKKIQLHHIMHIYLVKKLHFY